MNENLYMLITKGCGTLKSQTGGQISLMPEYFGTLLPFLNLPPLSPKICHSGGGGGGRGGPQFFFLLKS